MAVVVVVVVNPCPMVRPSLLPRQSLNARLTSPQDIPMDSQTPIPTPTRHTARHPPTTPQPRGNPT